MKELWFPVIVIGLAMVAAMIVAAQLRKRHLQRKVCLEIVNQGNMRSRYQLRAADPAGDLTFSFSLSGDLLPEQAVFDEDLGTEVSGDDPLLSSAPAAQPAPSGVAGAKGGVEQGADQAMRAGSALAGTLTALGTMLPRPLGAPLMRAASQLQQRQIQVSRAQRVPRQVASFRAKSAARAGPPIGSAGQSPAPAHRSAAHIWAETPSLAPGEALTVDLLIRSTSSNKDQHHTFQVVSRSLEAEDAPWVVVEGSVQIPGGFWARRFLPQIIIVALAVLALVILALQFGT